MVKKYYNGYPKYFMCIDEDDNAVWCEDAQYSFRFKTLPEARAIAIQYNAIAFEVY
jgi:hypothetical protein